MSHQINLGIQIVPIANAETGYPVIDRCISEIQQSGIPYQVTAFETILEGKYSEIMSLVDRLYQLALNYTEELVINIRIHAMRNKDVYSEKKTEKFND